MRLRRRAVLAASLTLLALSLVLPPVAAAGGCAAQPEWFTGVPDIPTLAPANTCQFEQWAWQTFLALLTTSSTQPVARYFTWDLPNPAIKNLYCQTICTGAAPAPKNPCGGPDTEEVVNATTQPGFVPEKTSGAVIDQAGLPVYFTAHVSPQWVGFVTAQRLYDPAVLGAADAHLAFPAGSFEIKTSWRLGEGLSRAERAQYYMTRACVVPEDKKIKPYEDDIALVGFHITGGADNHPELIWATFEHVNNAPDCDETPQAGPWALYDGKANCRLRPSLCNQPNGTDPADQPPINVCRKVPHGGAAVDTGRLIDHLNRDVQVRLSRHSPLRFYELVGSLWAANPLPAHVPTINLQQPSGSPLLSNTTLETFKQDVSCFGCHSSQFPGELAGQATQPAVTLVDKTLFVSHVVLFPIFFTAADCACPAVKR